MKTIQLIISALLSSLLFSSYGQTWDIAWDKQLGNQRMDYFKDVVEDINGGYTVLGSVSLQGKSSYDFWLVHFNEKGDTVWTRTLGTEYFDIPKRLTQVEDGSFLITGIAKNEGQDNLILIKTDSKGNEQWRKTFGSDFIYSAEDAIALGNEEFLLVGSKSKDATNPKRWIAKLDQNGDIVWEKLSGEEFTGSCKAVRKLPDGGYAVTGQMVKAGQKDYDIWVTRLNSQFETVWEKRVPSPGLKDWPECICCSPDSCFMITGWQGTCLGDINAENPTFDYDMLLVKMDKKGNVLWTKNFDKEGSEGGNAVTIRPNGNFVIAGIKATSFLGKIGPWLTLVDANGKLIGEKLINMHFNGDQAIKVINSSDGGIIVIGPGFQDEKYSRSDGWIMKFNNL